VIPAVGTASIIIFLVALSRVRLVGVAAQALDTSRGALTAMREPSLDERERERAVQRASVTLFGHFFSLLGRAAVAVAASLAPVALAAVTGLAPAHAVFGFLSRWPVWVVATGIAAAAYLGRRSSWPTS
jgi:hypothetical protein